jgi:DNA-binding NarL/FixJ family response regulator
MTPIRLRPHWAIRTASGRLRKRDLIERDIAILDDYSQGYNWHQIAERQGINEETVRMALHSLKERSGARNRPHLVRLAIEAGLLS